MTNTQNTIIEINGIKLDVDLRTARLIDTYKVGDTVKVLAKDYSSYVSYLGVIVGFDAFERLPTIIVAYLVASYNCEIKFAYINAESKDIEICRLNEWDIPYTKQDMINKFNTEINKKEEELRNIEAKKNIFELHFGRYFEVKNK